MNIELNKKYLSEVTYCHAKERIPESKYSNDNELERIKDETSTNKRNKSLLLKSSLDKTENYSHEKINRKLSKRTYYRVKGRRCDETNIESDIEGISKKDEDNVFC